MDFRGIAGQKDVVESLIHSAVKQRVAHAYIFNGPAGIGKKLVSGAFAALLLCHAPKPAGACGECLSCRMLEEGTNPDFISLKPQGTSIGVEEVRQILGEAAVKPMYAPRKVFLIAEADRMTVQAQNALLKTLEEPPAFAVLLLTVTNYDSLLPTIRSRTFRYSFKRNTPHEVRQALLDRLGGEIPTLDFFVSYSGGVIGSALEAAASPHFLQFREQVWDLIQALPDLHGTGVSSRTQLFEDNREDIDKILDIMASFYRDLLLVKSCRNENMLINFDKKDIILKNAPRFPIEGLLWFMSTVEETRRFIRQNVNYQLAIEVMLMKLQEVF